MLRWWYIEKIEYRARICVMTTIQVASLQMNWRLRVDQPPCEHSNLELEWNERGHSTGHYACSLCGEVMYAMPRNLSLQHRDWATHWRTVISGSVSYDLVYGLALFFASISWNRAGAGGIGSMRRATQSLRNEKRVHATPRKGFRLTLSRCRRVSDEKRNSPFWVRLSPVGKGLHAYVAVDASGTFSETKRQVGLLRRLQAGRHLDGRNPQGHRAARGRRGLRSHRRQVAHAYGKS